MQQRRVPFAGRAAEKSDQRLRNNAAVQKCREKKFREEQLQRARFEALERRVQELTAENGKLRKEKHRLQQLLAERQ